jgi:hypothetical protein
MEIEHQNTTSSPSDEDHAYYVNRPARISVLLSNHSEHRSLHFGGEHQIRRIVVEALGSSCPEN